MKNSKTRSRSKNKGKRKNYSKCSNLYKTTKYVKGRKEKQIRVKKDTNTKNTRTKRIAWNNKREVIYTKHKVMRRCIPCTNVNTEKPRGREKGTGKKMREKKRRESGEGKIYMYVLCMQLRGRESTYRYRRPLSTLAENMTVQESTNINSSCKGSRRREPLVTYMAYVSKLYGKVYVKAYVNVYVSPLWLCNTARKRGNGTKINKYGAYEIGILSKKSSAAIVPKKVYMRTVSKKCSAATEAEKVYMRKDPQKRCKGNKGKKVHGSVAYENGNKRGRKQKRFKGQKGQKVHISAMRTGKKVHISAAYEIGNKRGRKQKRFKGQKGQKVHISAMRTGKKVHISAAYEIGNNIVYKQGLNEIIPITESLMMSSVTPMDTSNVYGGGEGGGREERVGGENEKGKKENREALHAVYNCSVWWVRGSPNMGKVIEYTKFSNSPSRYRE